jgi:hypothetical protein
MLKFYYVTVAGALAFIAAIAVLPWRAVAAQDQRSAQGGLAGPH